MPLIRAILKEDIYNDRYGRPRILNALLLKGIKISESTLYRVLKSAELGVKQKRPKGLTKAEKSAYKNDNLLNGNFRTQRPNEKLVSDITQLSTAEGTLYISGVFDCFDSKCVGLSMGSHMQTGLIIASLQMAITQENIKAATFRSDRGNQYTSQAFRNYIAGTKIVQSMSHAGSSCYGNAKCESMWGRFKEEAIHDRFNTKKMSMAAVKRLVFHYFMCYWNNRRICHAIGGLPPQLKRDQYYGKTASRGSVA